MSAGTVAIEGPRYGDPREVDEADYPSGGSPEERLRFLLHYALLAPSSHNTQPWLFRIRGDEVEVLADRTRALPVVDPEDRELVMSCGAALFHLRVAVHHFGHLGVVRTCPPPERPEVLAEPRHIPDCLARLRLGPPEEPDEEWERLFRAIPDRRTNRRPFEDRPLPGRLLEELRWAADVEGAWLAFLQEEERRNALAELVAEGDRVQGADPRFRRELAAWVHPNRSRSRDGLPGHALGMGDLTSFVGPLVVRTFDWGEGRAAEDRQLALGSPTLAILGTDEDAPSAWMDAGQALDRVLLRAAAEGASASFLNQALEVESLRPRVADLLERTGHPQLVLRFGYGPEVPATPRRPLEEALV